MKYRPEINGLRAVAVIFVVLFHAGFQVVSGGFIGVDVFFVISGFLITTIIVNEKRLGAFSLRSFYERRARRILPALFVVMVSCIPAAWVLLPPSDMEEFSESLIAVSIFVSNIFFWRSSGYFENVAELKPLLHTWSLAVEEQYYLLFPIFMMLAWRFGIRSIVLLIAAVALISLVLANWGSHNFPTPTYFLLPTRGWELLIGALTALYMLKNERYAFSSMQRELGGIGGLALIAYSAFGFTRETPFPSFYALLPTVGAAMVLIFADQSNFVGKLLSRRAVVTIGLMSYSVYLWHQPIFAFSRYSTTTELSELLAVALICLTLTLSWFTWKFVEQPFRSRNRISGRAVASLAGSCLLCFIAAGSVGVHTNGFEKLYVETRLDSSQLRDYELISKNTTGDMYAEMFDDGECKFWARTADGLSEARFDRCEMKYGKATVVLGDSHAMNMYNVIAKTGVGHFIVGVSQGSCRPYDSPDFCRYDVFEQFVQRKKDSIQQVIYHQSGSLLMKASNGRAVAQRHFDDNEKIYIDDESIDLIRAYLDKISLSVNTAWLGPFPEARVNLKDFRLLKSGFFFNSKSLESFLLLEEGLKIKAKGGGWKFEYVSLSDALDIHEEFLRVGDCITYRDGDHLSLCGEDEVAAKLRSSTQLRKLFRLVP